jgi:hypothetical protein
VCKRFGLLGLRFALSRERATPTESVISIARNFALFLLFVRQRVAGVLLYIESVLASHMTVKVTSTFLQKDYESRSNETDGLSEGFC